MKTHLIVSLLFILNIQNTLTILTSLKVFKNLALKVNSAHHRQVCIKSKKRRCGQASTQPSAPWS